MQSFYQFTIEEVFDQLKTSASGLNSEVVPALQKKYGANVLQEAKQKTKLAILLSQFTDIMIIILVIAAIISFVVGEHTDAFVILAIIIGNAWMGYYQEYNAERSVRMLKKMAAQFATVLRNDDPAKIEADQLVPGDIILFTGTDSTERFVGHMGIIVSNADSVKFIHSTSGKAYGVTISPLSNYYKGRFVKTIRVFKQNNG